MSPPFNLLDIYFEYIYLDISTVTTRSAGYAHLLISASLLLSDELGKGRPVARQQHGAYD